MNDFDSITVGDEVEINSTAIQCGPTIVKVTEKIVSRANYVIGWSTHDIMITVTRKNFIRIIK